jgi:NDP-sugar pyrophosphorylase family protein
MKTKLLVLAAGMGSRFGGIKQIAGVGPSGETVLEYSVYDALEEGFDEVVFLIRREIEADFINLILPRLPRRATSRLVFQELDSLLNEKDIAVGSGRKKPWGTGHALLCAEEAVDAPFAVINADDFYGRASFARIHTFLAAADPGIASFCMAGFSLAKTTSPHGSVSRGLCDVGADSYLRGAVEHKDITVESGRCVSRLGDGSAIDLPPDSTVSMNLFGFTPAVFPLAKPLFRRFIEAEAGSAKMEFGLPDIVDSLIRDRTAEVRVLPTPEAWFGITYRDDLGEARERVAALTRGGMYSSPLWGAPLRGAAASAEDAGAEARR